MPSPTARVGEGGSGPRPRPAKTRRNSRTVADTVALRTFTAYGRHSLHGGAARDRMRTSTDSRRATAAAYRNRQNRARRRPSQCHPRPATLMMACHPHDGGQTMYSGGGPGALRVPSLYGGRIVRCGTVLSRMRASSRPAPGSQQACARPEFDSSPARVRSVQGHAFHFLRIWAPKRQAVFVQVPWNPAAGFANMGP